MDSEASVATKEDVDDDIKVEEAELSKKELVGQAAPLVDVSGKNSNNDKVNLFLLVSYNGCHCFCKAKVNISFSIITLIFFSFTIVLLIIIFLGLFSPPLFVVNLN